MHPNYFFIRIYVYIQVTNSDKKNLLISMQRDERKNVTPDRSLAQFP